MNDTFENNKNICFVRNNEAADFLLLKVEVNIDIAVKNNSSYSLIKNTLKFSNAS